MIDLTVAQIADIVGGELADISAEAAAELHVTGTVEFDSRNVTPGGLFLALPGARSDGHDHAVSAVAAGAVAVLAARPVGVPSIVVAPDTCAAGRGDSGLAGVLEHDTDGSGAAVLAALAKLAAAVAAELVAGGLTIVGITGS
jgi:UDP-N-acetylmuramoyl-tripeptide--D-alanyl-D-alanine ligase